MAHSILLPNEFESENVIFLPAKPNKLGGQSVLLNYKEGDKASPFILQTCRVRLPFGIGVNKPEHGGGIKYHLSFSLADSSTENENLRFLTDNFRKVDTLAKNHPQNNESWFGKKLKPDTVTDYFISAEKWPRDSKWASTLKAKLPFDRKGTPQFDLYDENKKPIQVLNEDGSVNLDCIPKGSEAVILVQSTGVWFVGKTQYGVAYKVVQAKIYKSNKLTGYSIVDDEDEDETEDTTEDVE